MASEAIPATNPGQPKAGFLPFLDAQAMHGVRDGAQVTFTTTEKDDKTFTTPEIELVYHLDATTDSCGFASSLDPANIPGTLSTRKLRVGIKANGKDNIISYTGPWNIDRVSIEDRGNGTTRVNVTCSKVGTPIEIDLVTPTKVAAEKWVPAADIIAKQGAT